MLKRKLAALLAGAMVLTSLPMVSFAATDNRVTKVPSLKKDTSFKSTDAPELVIKPKDNDSIEGNTIRLKFENAEWEGGESSVPFDMDGASANVSKVIYKMVGGDKTLVEFTLSDLNSDDEFRIPLAVKVKDSGEAKVTIDSMGTDVTAGTYVFANAGDGATKTTMGDTVDSTTTLNLKAMIIDELKAGSLPTGDKKEIKLTAPRGFDFVDLNGITLTGAGSMNNPTVASGDIDWSASDDHERIIIKYTASRKAGATNQIGSIVINNLKLKPTEDADFGDVHVKVSGNDITEESVLVGAYIDYGVEIKADGDPEELVSGRYAGATDDDAHKLQKLIIKENAKDSWWANRRTTIEFPDGVKVREVKVDDSDKITGATVGTNITTNTDKDRITIENLTLTDKAELVLEIFVSVEADFEGDIVATVGGPALPDEFEVVLGTAQPAVNVEVESTDLQIGYKKVEVGTITLTETKEEALQRGKFINLEIEDMHFDDDYTPEIEVTSGDLQLSDAKIKDGKIKIEVKRESSEPSTIEITGLSASLDRNLAEGAYSLYVSGDAIVENDIDTKTQGTDKFSTEKLTIDDYVNVVTPAPHKGEASGAAVTASFTVGSADYTVGDEVATADAAPYIKDGRTMIPVKYAAFALGVEPSNIKWDQATKTATILGDRVIQVKIGSKDLVVNGAVLTMDVAAEVVDGRTYLPISWVASALNVPYSWDDATKTVTFN